MLIEKPTVAITICICTFRRSSILTALSTVANQLLSDDISLQLIVIDNDDAESALKSVMNFAKTTGIEVAYRHVPGANIAIARNAGLDLAATEWLAFLDDDEIASEVWLNNLIAERLGATAIFGRCTAVYDEQTPQWIRDGDYHSTRIETDVKTAIVTGYAGNVLINMDFVRQHKLRFDTTLGKTGGEDTIFFREIYEKGGLLRYAKNAVVYEPVPSNRNNLRWIIQRKYRSGQIYGTMLYRFDKARYRRIFVVGPAKVLSCVIMTFALGLLSANALRWLCRGAFHLGVLSYAAGFETYPEYIAQQRVRSINALDRSL
jgi:succinoglycan biosynthesis protein ExoM